MPFPPNLKILKPYGNHNLEHDLQTSSRDLSDETASPELCLGHWTQHKHGNVVVVNDYNRKQMFTHGLVKAMFGNINELLIMQIICSESMRACHVK